MSKFQNQFIFLGSCILIGWGIFGLVKKEIVVGSRSYTGGTSRITKATEPLRFYFWCAFFILLGSMGLLFLAFG